jgi:preprotein translocase subunit SecA
MVTRSIESAQRKVEGRNFDIRKQLLEYDDVSNEQRKIIYAQRNEILESAQVAETIRGLLHGAIESTFRAFVPAESVEDMWDLPALEAVYDKEYMLTTPLTQWLEASPQISEEDLLNKVLEIADTVYSAKLESVGRENFERFEKTLLLQSIDTHWREHLAALDHLRQGIHLRGYAQKNPKQEYKREAFELFGSLLNTVRDEVARVLMTVKVQSPEQVQAVEQELEQRSLDLEQLEFQHAEAPAEEVKAEPRTAEPLPAIAARRVSDKVGRNDPCPCGSGKKFKQCHGKLS